MRHFRLPEPVDLILCEFDVLNHVERERVTWHWSDALFRAPCAPAATSTST
jgi:hypothetical protein